MGFSTRKILEAKYCAIENSGWRSYMTLIKKGLIKNRGRRVEFKGVMLNKAKNTTVNIRGLIYHENV